MNVTRGVIKRPQRVIIYGPEGIGKTTLASQFPDPLFIDTENGSSQIDVARIEHDGTWGGLLKAVNEVTLEKGCCKTLVFDTLDRAEQACINKVCQEKGWESIETLGYGKGYVYVAERFVELLDALDRVVNTGVHVVLLAHAQIRKFEQPDEIGAYDRWCLKLTSKVAPLVKEWSDLMFFLNYKTYVVETKEKTKKAQGGKRMVYTEHHPCWDAKNRYGLPVEFELDYSVIAPIFADEPQSPAKKPAKKKVEKAPETPELSPLEQLEGLMNKDGITADVLQEIVAGRGHYDMETPYTDYSPDFITGWCIKYWSKILELAQSANA